MNAALQQGIDQINTVKNQAVGIDPLTPPAEVAASPIQQYFNPSDLGGIAHLFVENVPAPFQPGNISTDLQGVAGGTVPALVHTQKLPNQLGSFLSTIRARLGL